jgi:hypothetical protein
LSIEGQQGTHDAFEGQQGAMLPFEGSRRAGAWLSLE